jgi:transposase-like protein
MSRHKRKFSLEERLSIVQESQREGSVETSRKYNLSPSLLSKWKQRYQQRGLEGLKPAYHRVDPQVRELELENERLKKIVAKQALQIEVQGELLKKTPISTKTK